MATVDPDTELLAPDQIATLLRVSQRTVNRWQALGKGPARIKIGQRTLYRASTVKRWLEQNEQGCSMRGRP